LAIFQLVASQGTGFPFSSIWRRVSMAGLARARSDILFGSEGIPKLTALHIEIILAVTPYVCLVDDAFAVIGGEPHSARAGAMKKEMKRKKTHKKIFFRVVIVMKKLSSILPPFFKLSADSFV
jgi:hypothetical protein